MNSYNDEDGVSSDDLNSDLTSSASFSSSYSESIS